MANTIEELIHKNEFKYNTKGSPQYNYVAFQQAISFVHGVEFLRTSNFSDKPVLFLLKVPVLSINLNDAEKTLAAFNVKLLSQLDKFIERSKSQFDMFTHFYELYRSVYAQQQEYRIAREEFFAKISAVQFDIKDIRQLKLPVIRANYKGLFHDLFPGFATPINYNQIGTNGTKHLEQLYLLRRRFNQKLLNELTVLRKKLFRENIFTNHYKYTGEIADVLEVALSLCNSGKMIRLDGKEITLSQFAKDFSLFLGRTFSTLQANLPTIDKRIIQKESFMHRSIKSLSRR